MIPEKSGIRTLTIICTGKELFTDPSSPAEAIAVYIDRLARNAPEISIPLPLNKREELRVYESHEAVIKRYTYVPIEEASDYASASIVVPYPPGIPSIIPGQKIEADVVRYLLDLLDIGGEIISSDRLLQTIRVVAE